MDRDTVNGFIDRCSSSIVSGTVMEAGKRVTGTAYSVVDGMYDMYVIPEKIYVHQSDMLVQKIYEEEGISSEEKARLAKQAVLEFAEQNQKNRVEIIQNMGNSVIKPICLTLGVISFVFLTRKQFGSVTKTMIKERGRYKRMRLRKR